MYAYIDFIFRYLNDTVSDHLVKPKYIDGKLSYMVSNIYLRMKSFD